MPSNQIPLNWTGSSSQGLGQTPLPELTSRTPKRSRASTTTIPEPTLPPAQRSTRTQQLYRAPALKPTTSYMFKGVHPLYSRHIIEERHDMMEIRCTQIGCD